MKKNTRWSRGEVWSRPSFCVELKLHISQGSARMHGVSSFCSVLLSPPPCECLSCCVFSHTMDSFECTRHSVKYVHRRRSVEGKKKKERKRPLPADDGPSLVLQKELVIDEDERAKTRVSVTAHRALRPSTIPWFLL